MNILIGLKIIMMGNEYFKVKTIIVEVFTLHTNMQMIIILMLDKIHCEDML